MNLGTKITIYKFTPQVFTLTLYVTKPNINHFVHRHVYCIFPVFQTVVTERIALRTIQISSQPFFHIKTKWHTATLTISLAHFKFKSMIIKEDTSLR